MITTNIFNGQNVQQPSSSAVKISNSLKRKGEPEKRRHAQASKKKIIPHQSNDVKTGSEQGGSYRSILHIVLTNIEDDTTDTEGSDNEVKCFVVHGKFSKAKCTECQSLTDPNQRCKTHQWVCECEKRCHTRKHFQNHLKQFTYMEHVYEEKNCYYESSTSKDEVVCPRLKLKPIRFMIQIIVPMSQEEWWRFLKGIGLQDNDWIIEQLNEEEPDNTQFIMSTQDYTKVRILYLTCALFGWTAGKASKDDKAKINETGRELVSDVTISGVANKKNCSPELISLLKQSEQFMIWKSSKQPPIKLFTDRLKARFAWCLFHDWPNREIAPVFRGGGMILLNGGSVSDQKRLKTKCPLKIEWEGEMYELEFETRDLSTFSGGDYFKGLKDDDEMKESRNIIHDLTEKSTEKTRRKCKTKKNKPINVGGSEWWRKPRILSQTNTKKPKEIFESTENEEISFKHKRRDRWSTRSWNGEYREFTKLASSTQDRVFRDSFLPCVDENFGSF